MNKWIGLALVAVAGSVVIGCTPQEAAPVDTSSTMKKSEPASTGEATPTAEAKKEEEKKPTFPTAEEQAAAAQKQVADTDVERTDATKKADTAAKPEAEKATSEGAQAATKQPAERPTEAKPTEIKASPDARSKMTPEQKMADGAKPGARQADYIGNWVYDIPAKQKAAEEKLVADMKKNGKEWSTTSISINLKPDGTFAMREIFAAFDRKIEGTYKIESGVAILSYTKVNGEAPKRGADKNGSKLAVLTVGNRARRLDGMEFVKR